MPYWLLHIGIGGVPGGDHGVVTEYIPDSQMESDRFPVPGIEPRDGNLMAVPS